MLINCINAAMQRAEYKILEDGTYFGEIPDFPGVWSSASKLRDCQVELEAVSQEWLLLGLHKGQTLPIINDIDLNPQQEIAECLKSELSAEENSAICSS